MYKSWFESTFRHNFNFTTMKAIIEKEYIVDKMVGDIKCGNKVLTDCIGIDRTILKIRFLSIPIYSKVQTFNEHRASPIQTRTSG